MRVTIDAAGRVAIPKALRDELGFVAGAELDVRVVDDRIQLSRPPIEAQLEERDGLLVAVTDEDVAPLTDDHVRAAIDRSRR